ncbi:hypothetical protein DSM25558_5112 [Agrobacterium sp. DSM 25558]|uniref:AAA family ATPase n=1 Tax=Agrobacterium sp. DSM 25558 TaxID=1907665 RepID=UPI000972413B|nr:AAA family ATPase [Agrobacterium sp. DSM 25558]SCX31075.1 hypothetical protein DSM25558_5112 [Agrobacterium sp. DSM 25558]
MTQFRTVEDQEEFLGPIFYEGNEGFPDDEDDGEPYEDDFVADMIPENGVGMLTGTSGAFKTFNALWLCIALTYKDEIFGKKINRNGGTAYFAFEGYESIRPRRDALFKYHNLDRREVPFVMPKNLLRLNKEHSIEQFELALERLNKTMMKRRGVPLVFVVIDTVIAAGLIKDELKPELWQDVFSDLKEVARRLDISIAIVAHAGKDASKGGRGSSANYSAADFEITYSAARSNIEGSTAGRLVALTKTRDGRTGPLAAMSLESVNVGKTRLGYTKSAGVVIYDESPEAIQRALDEQKAHAMGRKPKADDKKKDTDLKVLVARRDKRRRIIRYLDRGKMSGGISDLGTWDVVCSRSEFLKLAANDPDLKRHGKNVARFWKDMLPPEEGGPENSPGELSYNKTNMVFTLSLREKPPFLSWDEKDDKRKQDYEFGDSEYCNEADEEED